MDIRAKINKKIKYVFNPPTLNTVGFLGFDINSCPSSCFVDHGQHQFGLSKWVSPKRSRSYPYGRVYDTLGCSKRITVIPVYKEEGKAGDRDYLQWDTISLMSLLGVYVVLAYYSDAEKNPNRKNKITNQQFMSTDVRGKITEAMNSNCSAINWNTNELMKSFPHLVEKAKQSYARVGKQLGVELHSIKGIKDYQGQISKGKKQFISFSRNKAEKAQAREYSTYQPKEHLQTDSKAKITITDYLGGCYYFTTDETRIQGDNLFLIEAKHSRDSKLPQLSDIKDGFLKMILYGNLEEVTVGGHQYSAIPVLLLTSESILGEISSQSSSKEIKKFLEINDFTSRSITTVNSVMQEGRNNNILIRIEGV